MSSHTKACKVKCKFKDCYLPNWSSEEFSVDGINDKFSPSIVAVKDHKGDKIKVTSIRMKYNGLQATPATTFMTSSACSKKNAKTGKFGTL